MTLIRVRIWNWIEYNIFGTAGKNKNDRSGLIEEIYWSKNIGSYSCRFIIIVWLINSKRCEKKMNIIGDTEN